MAEPDEEALAPYTGGGLDDYEREYMRDTGALVAHDRQRAPGWMQALMASTVALLFVSAALTGAWGTLALLPVFVFLFVSSMVLRVNVSTKAVNVQYGLIGPTIPIAAIASAELREYNPLKFGGWGIKRSWGGEWIYNMPGDKNRAVRIVWHDAKGRQKITWIGSSKAAELHAGIVQARGVLSAGERVPELGSAADEAGPGPGASD